MPWPVPAFPAPPRLRKKMPHNHHSALLSLSSSFTPRARPKKNRTSTGAQDGRGLSYVATTGKIWRRISKGEKVFGVFLATQARSLLGGFLWRPGIVYPLYTVLELEGGRRMEGEGKTFASSAAAVACPALVRRGRRRPSLASPAHKI